MMHRHAVRASYRFISLLEILHVSVIRLLRNLGDKELIIFSKMDKTGSTISPYPKSHKYEEKIHYSIIDISIKHKTSFVTNKFAVSSSSDIARN